VPLVEQKLLTIPQHLSSYQVFSEVRIVHSLVFCVVFYRLFVRFSFGHSIDQPQAISCLYHVACYIYTDMYIPVPVPQPGQPQMPAQYVGQPFMPPPYIPVVSSNFHAISQVFIMLHSHIISLIYLRRQSR
jgi:hypothetical protein